MRRKGMERVTAGVLAAVMAVGMTGCANSGMSGTTTDLTGQYGDQRGRSDGREPEQTDRQDRQKMQERRILMEEKISVLSGKHLRIPIRSFLKSAAESRKQVQNGEDVKNTMVCHSFRDDGARDGADRSGRRHEAADGERFCTRNVGGGWQYGAWQDLQEPAGCREAPDSTCLIRCG